MRGEGKGYMKGNILLQNERPSPKDEPIKIPDFMIRHPVGEVKEEEKDRHIVREILGFIGLIGMIYAFLWIDAAPLPSMVGTAVGLFTFVWANWEEDK